ncbi:MAG: prepilin-type N-terminal cleavage/methylation domain-containing protein [Erysipelotrichaceae bacterium]|nr:prepilin-type N-terminal cleavage/methylation domain-containing protein [Erysipelotrichaceae bacterium]
MINKVYGKNGFTLAELLLAIIILLLATGIVAGGIPAAINAYRKVVDAANAQILLTTTTTCLRDEFDLASDIKVKNIGTEGNPELVVEYTSPQRWRCVLKNVTSGEKGITVIKGFSDNSMLLVSDHAAAETFYVTYDSVSISDNVLTFSDLQVYKKGTNGSADSVVPNVSLESYKVKAIKKNVEVKDD